ncbi:MAG: hypothetical protein L6407_02095, partial [Candidatus Delongbacteria bacterium]|nr:hypothetical protein [Candidatus Delongbacteria bacterium]
MKKMLLLMISTLFVLIFLSAREVSPKINSPANITIVYSGSTVTIGWDSVPNALKYYIYNQS